MESESGPSRAPRSSQRQVRSCVFCYRRKLKCDKTYPCGRCKIRGLAELCEQQAVVVNGILIGGPLPGRSSRQHPTLAELREENKTLHRKIASQERVIRSLLDRVDGPAEEGPKDDTEDRGLSEDSDWVDGQPQSIGGDKEGTRSLETMSDVFGLSRRDVSKGEQLPQLFLRPGADTLESLQSLIPLDHTSALVRFHCNFLHWIHTVFHIPSFLADHDIWIDSIRSGQAVTRTYGHYALYFAIIACSLYFMDDEVALEIGIQKDAVAVLPRLWFDLSINCIQLSGFLNYPTVTVIQAICILPSIAHAFDSSNHITSLMHCALGAVRDPDYHSLQHDPDTLQKGNIREQLMRRIWWCLMISDSLTPGAEHPFHLIYPKSWMTAPANVDDVEILDGPTLVSQPANQVTCVSHLLIMGGLADIFRDFCHSFRHDKTVLGRYKLVKACDKRLTNLFDDTPDLAPDQHEVYSAAYDLSQPYDFRPWSRYLWATAIPPMRIQLWRWFLGRSYTDTRFSEARVICLKAARDTIRMRSKAVPLMYLKNWHVSSYTVMSGMVFAIEMAHGKLDEHTRLELYDETRQVLNLLRGTVNPNVMVTRGIAILESMSAVTATGSDVRVVDSSLVAISKGSALEDAPGDLGLPDIPLYEGSDGRQNREWDSNLFEMLFNNSQIWTGDLGDGTAPGM